MNIKTYKFRIKDSSERTLLCKTASRVNYVWNWLNEKSRDLWSLEGKNKHWLSKFDAINLLSGTAEEIGLNSATIQLVASEHADKRKQFKKAKLSWRSYKRSLGWVPFDVRNIKVVGNVAIYQKHKFKFWKHREIQGKIKSGCFVQNSQGKWSICLVCEEHINTAPKTNKSVGIDLGLKEVAVTSDGEHFEHPKPLRKFQEKLAIAQRAKNKKQVTNIHAKIKNIRKDFNHKLSTYLVETYDQIFIGNVSSQAMIKKGKGFAKSTLDASWGQLRTMLEYKASRLGKVCSQVNESFSTITCSVCGQRTGPSGLSGLGVRYWKCSYCGTEHQRDVNSATFILNTGLEC